MGYEEVKDGGKRHTFTGGGQREPSTGKGRYDLLPPEGILRLAKHYENGARKYTKTVVWSIQECLEWLLSLAPNVEKIEICTPEGCAVVVMRDGSTPTTHSTPNDNVSAVDAGGRQIQSEAQSIRRSVEKIPLAGRAIDSPLASPGFEPQDFQSQPSASSTSCKAVSAPSVDVVSMRSKQFILTMTTQLDGSEASFAVGATTVLECLGMALRELRERLLISPFHQVAFSKADELGKVTVKIAGERNWEKGLLLSRFLDSTLRHLFQFMAGERSEDHLAAAAWNILGYITTESRIVLGVLPRSFYDVPWEPSDPDLRNEKEEA